MSSSAFESGDLSGRGRSSADAKASGDGKLPRDLLEQVLRETVSAASSASALDPAQMAALREVARRHRGLEICVDPVAADLVRAVLQMQFNVLTVTDEFWQSASRQIAQTLMDDPHARQRLEVFWKRMTEAAP